MTTDPLEALRRLCLALAYRAVAPKRLLAELDAGQPGHGNPAGPGRRQVRLA
ncbi:MAG TPA: hypothetical protein VGS14_12905 [Actinomycetes bacterium]|jgi:hypothetical protein|nr:hypothetical protein [Actinomycetes bacterium]